jgi:hypothetical protein
MVVRVGLRRPVWSQLPTVRGATPRRRATSAVVSRSSRLGLPDRILAQHRDDGSGRCTECTLGNQAGRSRFPCTLRILATEALVLQGRKGLEGGRPPWLAENAD